MSGFTQSKIRHFFMSFFSNPDCMFKMRFQHLEISCTKIIITETNHSWRDSKITVHYGMSTFLIFFSVLFYEYVPFPMACLFVFHSIIIFLAVIK